MSLLGIHGFSIDARLGQQDTDCIQVTTLYCNM